MQELMKLETQFGLSIYKGELFSEQTFQAVVILLKSAFGKDKTFYELLKDRLIDNKFTDKRLVDAVKRVIDKESFLSIEKIINYDKIIEGKTYEEMLKLINEDKTAFKKYSLCLINNDKLYIRNEEIDKYGFQTIT
jgi:hypothetical protein